MLEERDMLVGFLIVVAAIAILGIILYQVGQALGIREWLDSLSTIFQNSIVC